MSEGNGRKNTKNNGREGMSERKGRKNEKNVMEGIGEGKARKMYTEPTRRRREVRKE